MNRITFTRLSELVQSGKAKANILLEYFFRLYFPVQSEYLNGFKSLKR